MIELRKYERMHVYHVRAQSSKRTRTYELSQSREGGRVYEIKTLHCNLPPEGRGAFIRGGV